VSGPARRGRVAVCRRGPERLELNRRIGEEVVDQLGDELRVVADALAQLAQRREIQRTPQLTHPTETNASIRCFQAG
jgi:hypothetical protein